jgi:wyosine [tRNA(Phe)-imidazoG37] synthetase (radical SAM superfamily)
MADSSIAPLETAAPAAVDCPIVSGPQKSERMGTALGIDLGSQDMALAVSRDNRMPRASVVITTAARTIIRLSKAGEKVESIAVYGSETDPTLHPELREISGNLRDLRNKWYSKAKLWVVSDEPHIEDPEVRRALAIYDRFAVRLEWGTAKTFAAMTGRKSTEFAQLFAGLESIENLVIQSRFVRGEIDNSTDAEVKAWLKRLSELKPREVHIQNGESKVAARGAKKLRPIPKSRATEIAEMVTEKTGIPAAVYSGDGLFG